VPNIHFAFIALGKLGTGELMIGSDLDVMCVYDIPPEVEEGSEQMMQLIQYYNRLTTRLIHLLSHPTKQGALYEMDTKLRPYGAQGAVAVKLNAFREYYAASAWLVENLALLQARVVYVSEPIKQGLYDALWQAQQIPEPAVQIAENIHEVRRKISEQHFSSNPWDIKYVWGGLMDMQWVLKALIAHHSVKHHLPAYGMSTAEHIDWLYKLSAIDGSQRDMLHEAHELFHTVLNYLRLCHGDALKEDRITEGLKQLLVQVTGTKSFKKLQQELLRLQGQVYHLYQNLAYM
jgi:[glutamine synthetase] adenylyltransferase / [glutamine synthetase]-adenylyl-L-tyrosine phosphorylase